MKRTFFTIIVRDVCFRHRIYPRVLTRTFLSEKGNNGFL